MGATFGAAKAGHLDTTPAAAPASPVNTTADTSGSAYRTAPASFDGENEPSGLEGQGPDEVGLEELRQFVARQMPERPLYLALKLLKAPVSSTPRPASQRRPLGEVKIWRL